MQIKHLVYLIMLLLIFGSNREAIATTLTAMGSPEWASLPGNVDATWEAGQTPPRQIITWTFDLTTNPNYETVFTSKAITAAELTITLAPQPPPLNPNLLDIPGISTTISPTQVNRAVQANTSIAVNLLDLYPAESILKLLEQNGGKIPLRCPSETAIASLQLELATDSTQTIVPEPNMFAFFLIALSLTGYTVWRSRKRITVQPMMATVSGLSSLEPPLYQEIHRMKNILAGIHSDAELIAEYKLEPEERRDLAQSIIQESDQVITLTQHLLKGFALPTEPLILQTCSVKEFVQGVIDLIKGSFAVQRIHIQTELHYTGAFRVDLKQMEEVFLNIAYNARDAMPEGGTFTITSHLFDGMIQFVFTDTGCGMTSEVQFQMFEPYFTTGKPHGTGLGLAIVKKIIEQHQGQIEVESMEAQGTTISIGFPINTSKK